MPSIPLLLAVIASCAHAGTVQVAVAANFAGPIKAIASNFERDTGHKLNVALGATGVFYEQILRGAPFEVLLAADDEIPARLIKEGKAQADSRFTYAIGKLVLWSANPKLVDEQGAVLRDGTFKHLALANPKTAPYGRAAIETLQALGLKERLQDRIVQGDSVGQAYQFAASGNAELGFVALAQVWRDGKLREGSMWQIPPQHYQTIRQDAVLLQRGQNQAAAIALLRYLQQDSTRALIRVWGYDLPAKPGG